MKFVRFLTLSSLLAGSLLAADPNGTWECSVKGPDGQMRPLVVTLKADGPKLTGKLKGLNGQSDIEIFNGMNHEDQVMWSSKRPIQNAAVQFDYIGTFVGQEMKIEIARPDGKGATTNCTAKRSK